MPVNLSSPDPSEIRPVDGIELGFAMAGIKRPGRRDVMLVTIAQGSSVAAVFTQNSFAAAPVQVCRRHLASGLPIRALIINAGNANCGTGQAGIDAALRSCEAVAELADCAPSQVLPFSTGVILEPLPIERLLASLPECKNSLDADHWCEAASAIMTTDTVAKAFSTTVQIGGSELVVTGIAKGVGMLQPNMATMLAFVATNASVEPQLLSRMIRRIVNTTFNRVTVDGDTSTNDSFVLIATGTAKTVRVDSELDPHYGELQAAITRVARLLAQAIARDGEGATKFITVVIRTASDEAEAVRVAKSIAHSPLVKTAFFASDPNLGRLLMAIGNAGIPNLDVAHVQIALGDVQVIQNGERAQSYREEDGARVMRESEITIAVDLGRGDANATVWTCDFSYDYVKINAEYRT
jgi:glutamate N-acetyltransferase / amino-acid N-acetyltransferase